MTGLLSLVLWLPLAGAVTLLAIPQDRHATLRIVTLVVALLDLAAALCAGAAMDLTHTGTLQLVERASWIPSIGVSYHLGTDGLSLSLVVLTALLLVLCVVYSWRIETRVKEYMILLLLLETGLVGVFVALDLFLFYVFWEVSLVPMYLLIGIWGGPRRGYAAIKFFIYTVAGSLAMLLAILLVYVHSNPRTFDLVDLIGRRPLAQSLPLAVLAFWGFFLGFGVKVPLFPFHTWLPDAYAEAPTAGSVLLAGVMSKLGAYGFIRIVLPLLPDAFRQMASLVAVLAVIGAVYSALVALAQTDFKRMIAYSSVGHLGYVMLGVAAAAAGAGGALADATAKALTGATLQMLAHGIITGALFVLAGVLADGEARTRDLSEFGGLWARVPVFSGIAVLAILASLGLPGLMGFVAEFLIFLGAYQIYPAMTVLALVGVVLTVVYFLWAVYRLFFGPLNMRWAALPDLDRREQWVLAPLCALMVLFGTYPGPLVAMINLATANILSLAR
ncbi:MAG TPA: NADH-quinone oxidoreductase subunit M [bacterium]|nr:NADH-quinone oxidoreductase subunit M [bacterium]